MRMNFYKLCLVLAGLISILLLAPLSFAQETTPSTYNANRKFQAKQLRNGAIRGRLRNGIPGANENPQG
jgi:hypothetical protein